MKQRLRLLFATAFALTAAAAMAGEEPGSLTQRHLWLADASSLGQSFDYESGVPPKTRRGALGVGNGLAFALIGLDMPQNATSNMIGPDYETGEKWFGPVSHSLEAGGVPLAPRSSRLYRVRRTNVSVVEEDFGGLVLRTVVFAPPGIPAIVRLAEIENIGKETAQDVALTVRASAGGGDSRAEGAALRFVYDGKAMTVSFADGAGEAAAGALRRVIGDIPPGGRGVATTVAAFSLEGAPAPSVTDDPELLLERVREEWAAWLEGSMSVKSSDARLADFFENTLVMLKTQQSAANGAVAVMSRYSGAWCRDAYSPIRLFLLAGKFEEARAAASFYDRASRLVGFRNRYPANLDLSAAPDEFDWDSIRPQQGDDPNILILHIYNVWRAGAADDDYIRGHYGFMRRNLTSQFDAECRLPFHGDETYQVYVMMQTGAPMSDFYSVDTNFWHVAAAEAMSEMAAALGLEEDARTFADRAAACRALTDAHYWNDSDGYYVPFVKKDSLSPADSPFGDINFNALWMGYGAPSDEKLRRNALAAAKKLMNKTGGVKTSSRVSTFTGMLPGYLLYNLKALGLTPQADLAFDSLFNGSMSKTGEFAEAYGANNRWMDYTTHPNVLRPWETAINAEAVLYYLTGFRYDHRSKRAALSPSLPPGVGFVAVENLRAGQNRLSVYITAKDDGQLEVEARATGEPGFTVEMTPTNQD